MRQATSWDHKNYEKPLKTKKSSLLGTKKIMQPLGAKKNHATLQDKKNQATFWSKKNQVTSWNKKSHSTSGDKKNYTISQDKKKSRNLSGQKIMLLFKTKQKIMQPLSWDQKKSRNLLGQKNHTTSQDIKNHAKICHLFILKK